MKQSEFQFTNPELKEVSLKINDSFEKKFFEGFNINTSSNINKGKESAIVDLNVEIGGTDNKYPFFIKIKYSAQFKWDNLEENVDSYLQCNAPAVLFSYIRPIIGLLTSQTKYPQLNLPFINFTCN